LSRLDLVADFHGPLGDVAICRGINFCIAKVQFGPL
jgi:hypothetical protein